MKKFFIIALISLINFMVCRDVEALQPATTQVSKLCEVQAGGYYDLDQFDSGTDGLDPYEQTISCSLSISDASASGSSSAGFGPGPPQIGIAKAESQIDTYNGKAEAGISANVLYQLEIQAIGVPPGTPPGVLPVMFSARGTGYSYRSGYCISQAKGVVHLTGSPLNYADALFEFEAYVVDETAYDPVDEEHQDAGFNDTKFISLYPNYPYTVNMSAACWVWGAPVGQDANASATCTAQVDPLISFDQSAFDAQMGGATFTLTNYYRFVFSENLPRPPEEFPWLLLYPAFTKKRK